MLEDKRQYFRIVINAFVRFYQESRSSPTIYYRQGVVKNYSRGGMFVSTKQLLPKGSIVTMEIPIEDELKRMAIVQVRGVVRRFEDLAGQEGLGIEFFELKDSEHDDLQDWMAHLIVE